MAAVEDDGEVSTAGGDLVDELGQLLVGQVELAGVAAVVEDQGLVELVRLQVPELRRRGLLRAVPGVVEQRHVARLRLCEMPSESGDDGIPGRLVVLERFQT